MTDTDEIVWEYTEGSPYLGWIKDKDARKLVEDLLTETKRLREQNEILVEQLQNTRKWIRKYQKVFDEIAHQAAYVSCSALNIEEWIEEGEE